MNPTATSVLIAIALPLSFIACTVLIGLLPFNLFGNFKYLMQGVIATLAALAITFIYLKIGKSSFKQMGLTWKPGTLKRVLTGLFAGAAIAGGMLSIIVGFSDLGILRNEEVNPMMALFWMLAIIPLAFMEEVIFRGYAFLKLYKVAGLRLALVVMAILFAYYHDATGTTFVSQLMGPGIWAIIYGIAAVWSDGLALPTGIHIAANAVLAAFGLKHDLYAIWLIDYQQEITASMESQTNTLAIIAQILLLVLGILLTEWYIRKRSVRAANEYYVPAKK